MSLPMFNKNQEPLQNRFKNILAIAAGKGGVGKSTVTINLALALQKAGYKVGILDADVYGPSTRRMLIEDRLPSQKGEIITPALSHGIKLISMAYFRQEQESASVRAPIANNVISQFIQKVDWGELDFLLLDFPPGTGDIQLTLCQKLKITAAVVVTTPQEVAIQDVRKAMHLFEQVRVPILGIVENMSYFDHKDSGQRLYLFGREGGARLSQEKGLPFLGELPIDPQLSKKLDQGLSIFSAEHYIESTEIFVELSKQVLNHLQLLESQLSNSPTEFEILWNKDLEEKELPKSQIHHPSKDSAVSIKEIKQTSRHKFSIEWSDHQIDVFHLRDLQTKCPCAHCLNNSQKKIDPDLLAKRIVNLGRYAIRIEFMSGCSVGIYSYDYLRQLSGEGS